MPEYARLKAVERARLQPKLQMYANGSEEVNTVRAEQSSSLRVSTSKSLAATEERCHAGAAPGTLKPAEHAKQVEHAPPKHRLKSFANNIEANVFIQLVNARTQGALPGEISRKGRIVRARVPIAKLPALARDPRVSFVEAGEGLKTPQPQVSTEVKTPSFSERRFGLASDHKFGEDTLIGIVDVGGFDFSHPDFLDNDGRTRFVAIWDQGGDARPHPEGKQFVYGAEFLQKHLNGAIKAAGKLGVEPWEIERQSQTTEGSHGTHVASIAAGNRGICRKAPIAGVVVSLPAEDRDRRRAFYDSTRLADAVDYLIRLAREKKMKCVSINISLGTNGHAHDGSGAIGRYLDSTFSAPGMCLTVAAGNAGQEKAENPDDFGWVMGRIHSSGRIPAAQLVSDIEWIVAGNGVLDLSENELELWFSPQDHVGISLRLPNGQWTEMIEPLQYIENRRLEDGSFISIYNELHHPSNGANYISIYLSPNFLTDPVIGIPAGVYTVRLHGLQIRDGRYDGWIERDDPRPLGRIGNREAWSFPSFFSERSTVDNSTVSSLGCGQRVITVANLDTRRNRVHPTSSQGPSRDGRSKPDIAAPGTDIMAAKGFSTDSESWIGMTGTSMASPFVTGIAGLMLAIEPKLTGAQIEGIIRATAKPLPGASFEWTNDAGFGEIDPAACLKQAALINTRKDLTKPGAGAKDSL